MNRTRQRGATLVEFAIIFPLLFVLIMSVIEFGRAMGAYQTLTDAAREGARFGVAPLPGTFTLPGTAQVREIVFQFLDSAGLPRASANVVVTQTNSAVNGVTTFFTNVAVDAPYTFTFVPLATVRMSTQVVMRNEN
jgi:Flp pilus assembly protein TadG